MSDKKRPDEVVPMMFPSEYIRAGSVPGETVLDETADEERSADPVDGCEVRVRRRADPDEPPRVHTFAAKRVVVGRDPSCDLHLEDPQRITSSRHAEISIDGDSIHVTDLGSKNCTFVNNERLEPRTRRALAPGDSIEISHYLLRVQPIYARNQERAATVAPEPPPNPFIDLADTLAEVVSALSESYEKHPPGDRDRALREALRGALGDTRNDALARIVEALRDNR